MHFADPASYDDVAAAYDFFWPSPSPEVYQVLDDHGIRTGSILDVGIGTGLASLPLAQRGARITGIDPSPGMLALARVRLPDAELVAGRAEELPFADRSFDAAISCETFHWVDQPRALAELRRVVRPGGAVAIWWSTISSASEVPEARRAAAADAGLEPVGDALSRGFRAFFAAPFAERAMRAVPAAILTTVDAWVGYERARVELREAYGSRASAWCDALERRLLRAYGRAEARMTVRTVQYVYLARV
ncbi:MAG TPA: class I SAM-dependent methyltransferase [Candidatus Baltobacteraceae bacterium]|nr:class I SAM-dependent methyltransferase [Candidatus Baltobacteraceae bacterium]